MAILKDSEGNDVEVLTKAEVAEMVNGAAKTIERKIPKVEDIATKVSESLKTTVDDALKTYDEQRKTEEDKGKPSPGSPPSIEESPAFKALQRQLDDEKKAREKRDAELADERAQARASKLRQRVSDALVEGGVEAARVKHALHYLVDGEKRVAWDEHDTESLLFKDEKGELLPLSDGLKGWLKSDEAKIYLPPRGAGGSGGAPGASGPRSATNSTAANAAEALRKHILGG